MSENYRNKDLMEALAKAGTLSFDLEKIASYSKGLSAMGRDAEGGMVMCNHNYCIVVKDPIAE